jgi:outer membrane receptor protein involved in Fe transport
LTPTVGLTVRYVSDRTVDFDGDRPVNVQSILPSYASVGFHAGVTLSSLTVQLYVHNAFDRLGEVSLILPQFGDRVAVLQPRTVGLSAFLSF